LPCSRIFLSLSLLSGGKQSKGHKRSESQNIRILPPPINTAEWLKTIQKEFLSLIVSASCSCRSTLSIAHSSNPVPPSGGGSGGGGGSITFCGSHQTYTSLSTSTVLYLTPLEFSVCLQLAAHWFPNYFLTPFHEGLPLINVVCREVVLSNEFLIAKQGDKPGAKTEEGCNAHQDDQCRVVDVEVACEPGNKICVTCGLCV